MFGRMHGKSSAHKTFKGEMTSDNDSESDSENVDHSSRTALSPTVHATSNKIFRTTTAEKFHNYASSLYVRFVTEFPTLFTAVFLALLVALISSILDHFILRGLDKIENLGKGRHLVSILFVLLSTFVVQVLHPTVRGSGIPEMKIFLVDSESVRMKEYLSLRAFITKVFGLCLALLSGFPVGKEGPFVHISCIISYYIKFSIIPRFQRIFMRPFSCFFYSSINLLKFVRLKYRKKQIHYMRDADVYRTLCSACALGVACTFGAPIGGVMFSIEVTSKLFDVSNYWQGFFTASIGAIFFRIFIGRILHDKWYYKPFLASSLPDENYGLGHLTTYLTIGLTCGVLSSFFIFMYVIYFKTCQKLQVLIGHMVSRLPNTPYPKFLMHKRSSPRRVATALIFSLVISSILSLADFFFNSENKIPLSQHRQLELLFNKGDRLLKTFDVPLPHNVSSNFELDLMVNFSNYLRPMALFIFFKLFILCPMVLCLPVPAGIFFPVLTIGACVGRLIGDMTQISSAGCAIVGAAALSGSVTHSVSTAVILTEMTEEIQYLIPCACAAFLGKFLSQLLCRLSIYDMIMRQRFMPYVPDVDEEIYQKFKSVTAGAIVNMAKHNVSEKCLYRTFSNLPAKFSGDPVNAPGSSVGALPVFSSNDHLREVLRANAKVHYTRWFLLPVMRHLHGYSEMMGYVRCDAALSYLKDNFRRMMQFHCEEDWWLLSNEEINSFNSSDNILQDSFQKENKCCIRWFHYNKTAWEKFLSSEVDWTELLEEGPCGVRATAGIPDIHDFTSRNLMPQVFVFDGSQLLGAITREMFTNKVKQLHRSLGLCSVWYSVANIGQEIPACSNPFDHYSDTVVMETTAFNADENNDQNMTSVRRQSPSATVVGPIN